MVTNVTSVTLSSDVDPLGYRWTDILSGLTPDEVAYIKERTEARTYETGEILFHEGDPANDVIIVASGRIKCFVLGVDGTSFTLTIYGQGRLTGIWSALLKQPRMVTAQALEKTVIWSLKANELQLCMARLPTFSRNLLYHSASMASDSISVLERRVTLPAAQRLCRTLLILGRPAIIEGWPAAVKVHGLSQEEIAGVVGVSRTWINLILSDLERHNLIWRSRLEIGIYNPQALEQFLSQR